MRPRGQCKTRQRRRSSRSQHRTDYCRCPSLQPAEAKRTRLRAERSPRSRRSEQASSPDAAREEEVRQWLPRSLRQAQRAAPRHRMQPWPRGRSRRASSRRRCHSCQIFSGPPIQFGVRTTTLSQRQRQAPERPQEHRGAGAVAWPCAGDIGRRTTGRRSPRRVQGAPVDERKAGMTEALGADGVPRAW